MLLGTLLAQPCSSRFAAAIYATLGTPVLCSRASPTRRPADRRKLHNSSSWSQNRAAQAQTAAAEHIDLTAPATYISESNEPWFNLSYEDWLLRNTPHNQPVLFLYRNRPCVVIGRNQNPWQETTPRQLAEWEIPLIRRRSGGGTVFHDMGNTNFSILLPRLLFTRSHGAELVSRAIRERLGIQQCTVNDRNDVIIRDGDKDFKVSGSAYKIIQHRAYHHGTMLISSSLKDLGKSLRSSSPNIQGKSVASFRSAVTTLNTYLPASRTTPLGHDDFIDAVMQEFALVYGSGAKQMQVRAVSEHGLLPATSGSGDEPSDIASRDKVQKGVAELKSWEWTYGQTPEFTNEIAGELSFGKVFASFNVRHAVIQAISFHHEHPAHTSTDTGSAKPSPQQELDELGELLIGKRYGSSDFGETVIPGAPRDVSYEVLKWLAQSL